MIKSLTSIIDLLVTVLHLYILLATSHLIVNVKNKGGEIYQETIEANTTADTIQIQYEIADGTLITQLIDITNEIQIFKAIILPEEELGYTHNETLCFIFRFSKNEFISSDAMSKLRQKNPSAIRHPEEELPSDILECDVMLDVANSHLISPHIPLLCQKAIDTTYSKLSDLKLVSQILNRNFDPIENLTHLLVSSSILCRDSKNFDSSCLCRYSLCTGWYPCGLKYCKGKDSANRIVNYRCGIKTCSKCRNFNYPVSSPRNCHFDLPNYSDEFNNQNIEDNGDLPMNQKLYLNLSGINAKSFADDEE